MPKYEETHELVINGRVVHIGEDLVSFRDITYVLEGFDRVPGDGTATMGKLLVHRKVFGTETRTEVLYPSVFNGSIRWIRQSTAPITKYDAIWADYFHFNGYDARTGTLVYPDPKTGCEQWRRNGKTQTWKTRPDEFRVPVKYGLYAYSQIREYDASNWHTPSQCPYNFDEHYPVLQFRGMHPIRGVGPVITAQES